MPTTKRPSEEEFQRPEERRGTPDATDVGNPPIATEPMGGETPDNPTAPDVGNPPVATEPEKRREEQEDESGVRGHERAPTLADAAKAHVQRPPTSRRSFGVNNPQQEATDRAPSAQAGQAHAKAIVAQAAQTDDREEVLFRSEAHPGLRQYLQDGSSVKFEGQYYRTRDENEIRQMRDMIDGNIKGVFAQFTEEDDEPLYSCPFCNDFHSRKQSALKQHLRQEHPGLKLPKPTDEE